MLSGILRHRGQRGSLDVTLISALKGYCRLKVCDTDQGWLAIADTSDFFGWLFCLDDLQCLFYCLHFSLIRRSPYANLYGIWMFLVGSLSLPVVTSSTHFFVLHRPICVSGKVIWAPVIGESIALILCLSPFKPNIAPSTSKMLFPVCSQGGRNPGVTSGCVGPKMDLHTSLAVLFQLVFFVRWRTFVAAICLLGLYQAFKATSPWLLYWVVWPW